MGRRGPAPKPVEQQLRAGNPGHRKLPDVVLMGGRPVPVEWATPPDALPDAGKVWWSETVPILCESGLLDRADLSIVELAALMWARIVQSRRVLAQDGHFTTGSVGQLKEHPSLKVERESVREYRRLAMELGIGPLGRTNLGLGIMQGRRMMADLDAALGGSADDFIEGDAVPMTGAAVGLPGA
jgi:P27 family predicted phage terminase small subunit